MHARAIPFVVGAGFVLAALFGAYKFYSAYQNTLALVAQQQQALQSAQRNIQELATAASSSAYIAAQEAAQASSSQAAAERAQRGATSAQSDAAALQRTASSLQSQLENENLPASLLKDTMTRIAKITCSGDTYVSTGSGDIQGTDAGNWIVYTNLHVLLPQDTNVQCLIHLPQPPDYAPGTTYDATIVNSSASSYPDVDLAVLRPVGDTKERFQPYALKICNQGIPQIGDKVAIFGYPAYGGNTLTVTDGIVSGIETTAYGNIYKTSAKIDSGNSGGLAIDVTHKCGIGIPSWAVAGNFDGLGLIQSWTMMGYTK